MWGICMGYDVYAVLRSLWDCPWSPSEGGSFPQSVTRRLSWVVVMVRSVDRGVP